MSSLLQYLVTEAMIECHSDVLTEDAYRTHINNVFSTIPMYKDVDPKKCYLGIHAASYMSVVKWKRHVSTNSEEFWRLLGKIDAQVLKDDGMVVKVYKNKFPTMNVKVCVGLDLYDSLYVLVPWC